MACMEYLYALGLFYFTLMGLCIRSASYRDELWFNSNTFRME